MGHWYFLLAAVAAGILLWWTLGEKIIVVWRAARNRISPAPVPPPPTPAVVLDGASYDISTTPLHERKLVQDNALVRLTVRPRPLRNNEASMTLKEITVGARRRDTGVAVDAPSFKAPSLAPGGAMLDLPAIDFPQEQLEGLTEQNYQSEIVIWTRFEDPAGNRWEVVWDPETRTQSVDLLA